MNCKHSGCNHPEVECLGHCLLADHIHGQQPPCNQNCNQGRNCTCQPKEKPKQWGYVVGQGRLLFIMGERKMPNWFQRKMIKLFFDIDIKVLEN